MKTLQKIENIKIILESITEHKIQVTHATNKALFKLGVHLCVAYVYV